MFADFIAVLCIVDILEAEPVFSVTQSLPSERFSFLSVHNYRPLFCFQEGWIYWISDSAKNKSCHSNLIDGCISKHRYNRYNRL